ncbi:hypothetical protein [Pontibacter beigongshangensis]|uniref:hypothetical protein n=1 Tax=Pontibacter beigongshangensis TaxID=2574733 RepID=UPI0016501B82|nr:hypothetical protein [Pontibacter beigongshangensis]
MRNISSVAGGTAGIRRFYFTAAENLPRLLQSDGVSVTDELTALFYFFEATRFTPEFNQPDDDDKHGTSYTHELSGFVAGDTPELATALLALKGRKLVLLYLDFDGYHKLAGDREHYLVFDYRYSSGTTPGDRKGYRFSFNGKSRNPALFYTGTFEVSEEGTSNQPQPGGNGEPVQLKDTHGNLIALIPSGKTLVIRSGFKLTYQII